MAKLGVAFETYMYAVLHEVEVHYDVDLGFAYKTAS